jgi:hypothetical protein
VNYRTNALAVAGPAPRTPFLRRLLATFRLRRKLKARAARLDEKAFRAARALWALDDGTDRSGWTPELKFAWLFQCREFESTTKRFGVSTKQWAARFEAMMLAAVKRGER